MQATDFSIKNGSKTRVQFIKYHEAADQQPLSKKAAEKLGIFPSLALVLVGSMGASEWF